MNEQILEGFLTEDEKKEIIGLYLDVLQISPIIRDVFMMNVLIEHNYDENGHYEFSISTKVEDKKDEYSFYYKDKEPHAVEDMKMVIWKDILSEKISRIPDREIFNKVKTVVCALVD